MVREDAIKILCNVARAACKAGLFQLDEAPVIAEAVKLIETPEPPPAPPSDVA